MENPDSQDNKAGDNSLNETNWRLAHLRLKQVEQTTEKLVGALGALSSVLDGVSSAAIEQLDSIRSLGEAFEGAAGIQVALVTRVQQLEEDMGTRFQQLEEEMEELKRRLPKAS